MINQNLDTPTKLGIDIASITVLLMTMADVFMPLTIMLTFLWTCIRIWETDTVQRLLGRTGKGRRREDDG